MEYKPVTCASLINTITKKDTLFAGNYTVDPYQQCEFGCRYCDSSTDETIYIKSNAVHVFEKEIEKLPHGVIIVGSVHDPYQKAERSYQITRNLLRIIQKHKFPCHILTKSDLVLRDLDILSKMDRCLVTLSITTLDNAVSNIFEKNVPSPEKRLRTMKSISEKGIKAGIAITPVLPYFVETELEEIVNSASLHKAWYIVHKHLELKGDQKRAFLKIIEEHYPHLLSKYKALYGDGYTPNKHYSAELNSKINDYCTKYGLKSKI